MTEKSTQARPARVQPMRDEAGAKRIAAMGVRVLTREELPMLGKRNRQPSRTRKDEH
jgi:hypothetical protein